MNDSGSSEYDEELPKPKLQAETTRGGSGSGGKTRSGAEMDGQGGDQPGESSRKSTTPVWFQLTMFPLLRNLYKHHYINLPYFDARNLAENAHLTNQQVRFLATYWRWGRDFLPPNCFPAGIKKDDEFYLDESQSIEVRQRLEHEVIWKIWLHKPKLERSESGVIVRLFQKFGFDIGKVTCDLEEEYANPRLQREFANGVSRTEAISKLKQLGLHILKHELIFLLVASVVIYSILPQLPGIVISGTLTDAIIMALMISICSRILVPLMVVLLIALMLLLAAFTPLRSKLHSYANKLIKRNQEDRLWKLMTQTTYCFFVSLCVLITFSAMEPKMLTSHSWYTLPMAAATIAMVLLIQDLCVTAKQRTRVVPRL
jgi:hypothetical protein